MTTRTPTVPSAARSLVLLLLATALAAPATARDTPCRERRAEGSTVVVAEPGEPGEPMEIRGRVTLGPGHSPVAGARVLVFHTDAEGYYSPAGMDEEEARLCGVVETGADGSFVVRSIRPAPYATGGPPAHVHLEVSAAQDSVDGGRARSFSLTFADDPRLADRPTGEPWSGTRPVRRDADGVWVVERELWLRDD